MTADRTRHAPFGVALDTRLTRRSVLKRAAVLGVSLPAISGLLAACGSDDDPTATTAAPDRPGSGAPDTGSTPTAGDDATPASTESPGEERTGGTMVILAGHEVSSLSPDDVGTWVHTAIIRQMHDGLTEIDEMLEVTPALARSWEISDDGLTYTFDLHDGVLFHDGEPCSSEDVVYTYEFHMNIDNATNTYGKFAVIESVEAPDDTTFIVHLSEPDASFLTIAAPIMIYPQHYHSEIGEDAFKSAPIGTGPFRLKEYRAAEFVLVEAFDDHFRGRPFIDALRMNVVPEASVRALQLQTGEADANVSPGLIEEHIELAEDPNIRTFSAPSVILTHVVLNNTHPVLREKAVRQAMMHAIDRETLIEDIALGQATLATANIAPSLEFWYNPNVKQYEYDPDKARQMLDEAGWVEGSDGIREKDGQRAAFTLTVSAGQPNPLNETIQQYLQAVGIDMEIREAPVSAIQEGMLNGDIDAARWSWGYGGWDGEPDARPSMQTGAATNWMRWSHERVDELLKEGVRRSDPAERKEVYDEIQEIVAEEVPFLFLYFPSEFTHFNRRIRGLPEGQVASGANLFAKVREWWIEE